jgi:sortase A
MSYPPAPASGTSEKDAPAFSRPDGKQRGTARRRAARVLGTVFLVVGVLLIVWSLVVWRFGDPVTGGWYRFEQHRLEASYDSHSKRFTTLLAAPASPPARPGREPAGPVERSDWAKLRPRLALAARMYGRLLHSGDPVGSIIVPRLSLHTMLVDGTSSSDLRRGPGLDERTSLPGRGHLVYIAGHRTTFGAPFGAIDKLRPGDPIELRLPYATFRYVVTSHRIARADDVTVLADRGHEQLVLQACHPRFFATHRYLVDARLVAVVAPGVPPLRETTTVAVPA